MADFFKHPILNSPYAYPARHWELDAEGSRPTGPLKRAGVYPNLAEYFFKTIKLLDDDVMKVLTVDRCAVSAATDQPKGRRKDVS